MRRTILIAMAAIPICGFRDAAAAESKKVVTVYMLQESVAPTLVVMSAKAQATRMFADIGISIQWRIGAPHASLPRTFVIIEMGAYTPKDCYPGALAYAKPYDHNHVKVFYDRISTTVYHDTVPALLAHVLVHEITHILQGFSRHSSVGIMKPRVMPWKPLAFTQQDIYFIRMGLSAREAQSHSQQRVR